MVNGITKLKPTYDLSEVQQLVKLGAFDLNFIARKTAKDHFGWKKATVGKAMLKLKKSRTPRGHFYKSAPRYDNPRVWVDYYKAPNLMGEDVYIHFRVENDRVIICSFKKLDEEEA